MESETNYTPNPNDIITQFLEIERNFCDELALLHFSDPVCYVYNPLIYAKNTHECYVRKFCQTQKTILVLGMNPGPWGMNQTGVPFGEINSVKNWMKIEGSVGKPAREHPNRPILGFECHRSEVSGRRFWGFIRDHSGEPEVFFRHAFVHNYCPLAFLANSGKNITPPDLKAEIRNSLFRICDKYLYQVVKLLNVRAVIGIGKFAKERTTFALRDEGLGHVKIYSIMHPSPVNPEANKGWDKAVKKQLEDLDLMKYFNGSS